jgi:hypothetical protein
VKVIRYVRGHVCAQTHTETESTKAPNLNATLNDAFFFDRIVGGVDARADSYFFFLKSHGVLTKPTFTTPTSYLRGQGKAAQCFAATGVAVDLLKWSNRSHSFSSPYFHCLNICFWHANLVT